MPATSATEGLRCPVDGCGGLCRCERGSKNVYGKRGTWILRHRVCESCGAKFTTREMIVGQIQKPLPVKE